MSTATLIQDLTRSEADLIVRHTIGEAYEEFGYNWLDSDSLARKLAFYLDADVDAASVQEAVGALKDLQDIAYGVHEELRVNNARTVDNTDYLNSYYEGEFNVAVNTLLDASGIEGAWLLRHTV